MPPFSSSVSEKEFLDYLDGRKGLLDAVVITGGEPTLQSDLLEFMEKIKTRGLLIKLDTCGAFPKKVKESIDSGFVDYVAMDIKSTREEYEKVTNMPIVGGAIEESIALILGSELPHEFRSTIVEGLHDEEKILAMAQMIEGANAYYLQQFRVAEEMNDNSFKGKKSLPKKELEQIAKKCKKYVKMCDIR